MKAFLAAHDPSAPAPFGDYWVQKNPSIDQQTLDAMYSIIARSNLPKDPNVLTVGDCHGGCVGLDAEWCAFYRCFNGGRDCRGRPGRSVLLCALLHRTEVVGRDATGVLDGELFTTWAQAQPIPSTLPSLPESLESKLAMGRLASAGESIPSAAAISRRFTGTNSAADSWTVCASLPADRPFHWRLRRHGDAIESFVDIKESHVVEATVVAPATPTKANAMPETSHPPKETVAGRSRRRLMRSGLARQMLLIAILLVVGFSSGYLVAGNAKGRTPDHGAMQRWLEQYQSPVSGRLVSADDLLRRIRSGDWATSSDVDSFLGNPLPRPIDAPRPPIRSRSQP